MCIVNVAEYIIVTVVKYYYACRKSGGMSVTRACFRHPQRSYEIVKSVLSYEIVKSVLNYIHCILLVNSGPSVAQ